jgi:hypothetical protein
VLGKVLETISRPQPKKIQDITDLSIIKLIDQWRQAKIQWLQNSSQIGDNLQNLRHETTRIFRNKKREYLKDKINSLRLIIKTEILEICTEA